MANNNFAAQFDIGARVDFHFIHPKTALMRATVARRNVRDNTLTIVTDADSKRVTISADLARKVRGRRPAR